MSHDAKSKPKVVLAQRFAESLTYNAWTALSRARQLIHDAQEVGTILKSERDDEDAPIRDWFGFEVISYYMVGFVTCLEWHARTRLADLYSFKPQAIDKKALDGKVSPELLSQMISAGVTVPHFLSASMTVGGADEYLGVLQRLFDELGIHEKVCEIIQEPPLYATDIFGAPYSELSIHERLTYLFQSRHALVHEIAFTRMSSPAISDNWGVDEVIAMGRFVETTIQRFERALTTHAPPDFPNLFDDRLGPIDERARLSSAIDAVKNRITYSIESISIARGIDERDGWTEVLKAHDTLAEFIEQSNLFEQRYTNPRLALSKFEMEQRLKILESFEAAIGNPNLTEEQ